MSTKLPRGSRSRQHRKGAGSGELHDAVASVIHRDFGAVGGGHLRQPLDDAVVGGEPGISAAPDRQIYYGDARCLTAGPKPGAQAVEVRKLPAYF